MAEPGLAAQPRIKARILVPFAIVLLLVIAAFIAVAFVGEAEKQRDHQAEVLRSVEQLFRHNIDLYSQMMAAVLPAIADNRDLQDAFRAGERQRLFDLAHPLFLRLQKEHAITHFYFLGANRVTFLRVHQPLRFGDRIDRRTAMDAERTRDLSTGMELGPLGTLTLRAVYPWMIDGAIAGYLEVGVEVDHIVETLHRVLGTDLAVVVRKDLLDRANWISGMRMVGRDGDWDAFPRRVVVTSTRRPLPAPVSAWLAEDSLLDPAPFRFREDGRLHTVGLMPLADVGGRQVGGLVVIGDVSAADTAFENRAILVGGLSVLAGTVVFAFFFVLLDRLEHKLLSIHGWLEDRVAERTKALEEENAERRKAEDSLRLNLADHETLAAVARLALDSSSLDEILKQTLVALLSNERLRRMAAGNIFLIDEATGRLHMRAHHGLAREIVEICRTVAPGQCLCGRAAKSGEVVFSFDVDARHDIELPGIGPHGHYCVPIQSAGKTLGVLNIYLPEGHPRDDGEERLLLTVSHTLAGILERRLAQDTLKTTLDDLQRTNAQLERLTQVAAHDLQEPARTVTTYAQLLETRHRDQMDAEARERLDFLLAGARRMGEQVRALLAYARISGTGTAFAPVDSGTALEAATKALFTEIIDCGAEVHADSLPLVLGEAEQLATLFENLLSNALKFRSPDRAPDIGITARRTDGEWEFSLRDNGMGIEADYLEQIFVVFKRLHTLEAYPGTGVGLAICQRIVERHHGRIWAESAVGQGTTIHFTLPATQGREA